MEEVPLAEEEGEDAKPRFKGFRALCMPTQLAITKSRITDMEMFRN